MSKGHQDMIPFGLDTTTTTTTTTTRAAAKEAVRHLSSLMSGNPGHLMRKEEKHTPICAKGKEQKTFVDPQA
jgi:hypothetical protein